MELIDSELTLVFEKQNLRIIGTLDIPLFNANDVLKILEYPQKKLKRIASKYKKTLDRVVYFNEEGLCYIMFLTDEPHMIAFRQYIIFEVMSDFKKKIVDINKQLISQLDQLNKAFDSFKLEVDEKIIPNRNIPTKDPNLHHVFALYKINDEYKFIRSQKKYLVQKMKTLSPDKIIIPPKLHPNPIDLVNKIHEVSVNLNTELLNNIREDIKEKFPEISKHEAKNKEDIMFLNKKHFEIKRNYLVLNKDNIEDVKNVINDVFDEQKRI